MIDYVNQCRFLYSPHNHSDIVCTRYLNRNGNQEGYVDESMELAKLQILYDHKATIKIINSSLIKNALQMDTFNEFVVVSVNGDNNLLTLYISANGTTRASLKQSSSRRRHNLATLQSL